MRIAFDARMVENSGIGTHIRGLLRALARQSRPPELALLGDLNALTRLGFNRSFVLERHVAPIYSVWAQLTFPRRWKGAAALHVPHYNVPYRYADPLIVTVHDLIHLLFPWQTGSAAKIAYARYTFRQVARRAAVIFCVSESTRRDVMERLGVAEERTALLPNAVDEAFQPVNDTARLDRFRRQWNLPREYLLAVGINKPHKNYPFLLRSLAPLWRDKRIDAPLAIAGCGPAANLRAQIAELGLADHIRLLDWVPGADMPLLYQGAAALVFPSTYEGFGLPLLEAQRMGVPVAASDAASLPEVGGDGAEYFDPYDEESCRHVVARVLTDSTLRRALIANGQTNERRFSWDRSAERLAALYGSLGGR